MSINVLILISVIYTGLLFYVAYYADRVATRNLKPYWLRSPLIYTLSLSVYCTAWTFYGAVGSAARTGMEFLAIYIGPSLMFFGYWFVLRRMVRVGHAQNATSIADFLSSRFGKSNGVAVIVTILSVVAATPYIALQLQSISQSFSIFASEGQAPPNVEVIGFFTSVILAIFAMLFGTRHARMNERHHGVVVAVALESVVKLVALLIVGYVLVYQFGGVPAVFATKEAEELMARPIFSTSWFSLVSLSFMAVIVLPRMFHMIVVENENEDDLLTASWAFPLYLLLLNLFVLPVAIIGLNQFGNAENSDYFLLTLPLRQGNHVIAYIAFIGGLSAATSMIVVTAIALATMISNHIAMPLWLDARERFSDPDDVNRAILRVRRSSIVLIMLLGFVYFEIAGGSPSLASVGLIAFVGVSQLFPALIAALFWRGATKSGAIAAILIGSFIWGYTLLIPSLGAVFEPDFLREGPMGVAWLAPYTLFGVIIENPVVHALFWSILFNALSLFFVSIFTTPKPLERLQANQFVDIFDATSVPAALKRQSDIRVEEYYMLGQRVLGQDGAQNLFEQISMAQERDGERPIVNDFFFDRFERALGGVVGSAAAHALISQLAGSGQVPVSETIKLADETVQNIEYARALENQRLELETTALALREANASLVAMDAQKDAFLSQISHELRTPLTAIRSFADILLEGDVTDAQRQKMLEIISRENHRLTALLDDILDLSYLESGSVRMALEPHDIREIVEHAMRSTQPVWQGAGLQINIRSEEGAHITLCDYNRLLQVFINLITNAAKYVTGNAPALEILLSKNEQYWLVDFQDNGPGIVDADREVIFEKFSRGQSASDLAGSAGLGLAISREIAQNLGGKLELISSVKGSCFRVSLRKSSI